MALPTREETITTKTGTDRISFPVLFDFGAKDRYIPPPAPVRRLTRSY